MSNNAFPLPLRERVEARASGRETSEPLPGSVAIARIALPRGEGDAVQQAATKNIVVIGQGAAGLSAALAAAEAARAKNLAVTITLIDKAAEADAGGNTRWTPSYMRMAAVDRVEPSFVHDMLEATKFQGDEDYFATLAAQAPATVQWIAAHGVPFHQPVYYLAKGPPRIQPVGGGETIHRELSRAARDAGVVVPPFLRGGCADRRRRRRDLRRAARFRRDAAGRRRDPRPAAASRPTPR